MQQQEEMNTRAKKTQGLFFVRNQQSSAKRNTQMNPSTEYTGFTGLDNLKQSSKRNGTAFNSESLSQMTANMIKTKNGSKLFQIKTHIDS